MTAAATVGSPGTGQQTRQQASPATLPPRRGRIAGSRALVGLLLAGLAALFAGGCADQGPFYDEADPLGYGYYGYPGYYDPYYGYYDGPYVAGGAFLYG